MYTSAVVNGLYRSYILNEFFAENYDELFEYNYCRYKSTEMWLPHLKDNENIEHGYYIMVFLDDSQKSENVPYQEYNNAVLGNISDYYREITYVGSTTPCAVLLIDNSFLKATEILALPEITGVYEAFGDVSYGCILDYYYQPHLSTIKAADARRVLRVSAGLDTIASDAKAFYCFYDFNFDDKITAADARLVLRVAADLEEAPEFEGGPAEYWLEM